jgi:EmrB/QacA subfamily drug resistance transporter
LSGPTFFLENPNSKRRVAAAQKAIPMKLPSAPQFNAAVSPHPAGQPAPDPAGVPPPFHAPLEPAAVRSIIAGIMLAMFLSALEQTIVAPALPTMGLRLGNIENLSWVVGAYLLAATAVTPLFGKLSDVYGRRIILLICVSIFIVGSIACAVAPTMWTLIAARALQGLGGGGILPIAQTIIADLVPPRERPRYQTQSAIMFMIASVIGPLIGGILTDHLHWSLIFWINVPMGALALVMTYRALERLPRNERPHKLDWIGGILMVAATLTLMLAMKWGGVNFPWASWPIAALAIGSVALWGLFAWRLATAAEPFIPLEVLREPAVAGTVVAAFFSIGAIIGLSIYLPLYLQLVLGASPSMSGFALIAFTAGTVAGAFSAGRSLARHRHYKYIPMAGLVIAATALGVMAIMPSGLSLPAVAGLLLLCGGGIGTMYPVTTILIQNAVRPHQFGVATGTMNFSRLLGGTIVVAAFGAIVLGKFDTAGGLLALDRLSNLGAASHGGADFSTVFGWVFAAASGCLAAALVAVALIEERPLRGRTPPPEVRAPLRVEKQADDQDERPPLAAE